MKRIFARWKAFGTRSSLTASVARLVIYALLFFLAIECVTINFKWPEQAVLGVLTIALTFAIHRISGSETVTLALMFASMLATARYAYWRCTTVAQVLADPNHPVGWINVGFIGGELQMRASAFGASVGYTPHGFLIENIMGRLYIHPPTSHFTVDVSREALLDTQLSYAGLRDEASRSTTYAGNVWGA